MTQAPARRIAPPDWLGRPGVRAIQDAIGGGRFVGGAVRDTLLHRPVGDLDLATPLPPDEILRRLEHAGIQAIPTGIAHGTVTALADGQAIEITTLRRDVETDGRHATVAYTDDWAEDAARRDFTMNALYLDAAGDVWDPVGGIGDCLAGRVRFVGEPRRRIAEDYLRVLRFYRFQAQYGRTVPDADARAACRAMTDGLRRLSGERVRTELLKLLAAPDPAPTVALMVADGVWRALLPEPADLGRLRALVVLEESRRRPYPSSQPPPSRGGGVSGAASLLPSREEGGGAAPLPTRCAGSRPCCPRGRSWASGLKLSGRDAARLAAMTAPGPAIDLGADTQAQRRLLYRLGAALYRDRLLLTGGEAARTAELSALADAWTAPSLPVTGADVQAQGIPEGRAVGILLRAVEAWWIGADFAPDRAACLARLAALTSGAAASDDPLESAARTRFRGRKNERQHQAVAGRRGQDHPRHGAGRDGRRSPASCSSTRRRSRSGRCRGSCRISRPRKAISS